MTMQINIPNIGDDILEVTEILVQIGDNIIINQPLLIIEGDKSSIEIPTPYAGIVTAIHLRVGDKVHTGALILSINTDINSTPLSQVKNTLQHTIKTSKSSEKNQIDPSNMIQNNTINIPQYDYHTKKTIIHTNQFLVHATPLIRHMARKFKIDLSKIQGSGRKGRILKEDIENYIQDLSLKYTHHNYSSNDISEQPSNNTFKSCSKINFKQFGDIEITKLNKIQKISGTNLQKNWSTIPHVTQFDLVDITDLEIFRQQQNIEIEKQKMHYKITILVFVMKAVAKGLEELPQFNSSLSQDGNTLILKKYINIGIAVDTINGLLVPVLRDVNKKGIITLSKELSEIAQKARSRNQLTPFDMKGGSFTISNLGGIGGTAFTPIINAPEVAILGMSKSATQPIWTGKKFIPRLMLPLSLSYDHRVIDGAYAARFIKYINTIISDIRLLSM